MGRIGAIVNSDRWWGPVVCGVATIVPAGVRLALQIAGVSTPWSWRPYTAAGALGLCFILDGVIERTGRRGLWLVCLPIAVLLTVSGALLMTSFWPEGGASRSWRGLAFATFCTLVGLAYVVSSVRQRSFVFTD